MEYFFSEQHRLIESVSVVKRYLYTRIEWSERCIGILGVRGTGKTTLMLQHVRERYGDSDRELFCVNQLRNSRAFHPGFVENTIELSAKGDFIVKSEYTFEIGGKGKRFNQISGVEKSFMVADDIETGFQNKIPLWLFGFLY